MSWMLSVVLTLSTSLQSAPGEEDPESFRTALETLPDGCKRG